VVLDVGGVGAAHAQPRLLQRVVGVAVRAQHAARHGAQVRAVALEPLGGSSSIAHFVGPFVARTAVG
jgi:hypothetical protein